MIILRVSKVQLLKILTNDADDWTQLRHHSPFLHGGKKWENKQEQVSGEKMNIF